MARGIGAPTRRSIVALIGTSILGGCGMRREEGESRPNDDSGPPSDGSEGVDWELPTGSPLERPVEAEPLAVNLRIPWDLAFTPPGDAFVTVGDGQLLRFETDELLAADGDPLDAEAVSNDDRKSWLGEHAMGVAVHPSYPDPAHVYVYYGTSDGNRVARFDVAADDPEETLEVLVEGIEGHYTIGGRLAFGPDDDLWVTVGTSEEEPAQDPGELGGTILRVTPDGAPSPENPDLDGADPRVFTYGHRNPQGLAWLPDGTPLCTDHGPDGRDEVVRLQPGANSGWPTIQGGPDDDQYESYADGEVEPPLVNTGPEETWAPAGCVFYRGEDVPTLRHRLVVGTLRGAHLNVVTLLPPGAEQPPLDGEGRRFGAPWLDDEYIATSHRVLEGELGRIRHVAESPNGDVLAVTSNHDGGEGTGERFPRDRDDVIARIRPA